MYNIGLVGIRFPYPFNVCVSEAVEEKASLIRKVLHCKISIKFLNVLILFPNMNLSHAHTVPSAPSTVIKSL